MSLKTSASISGMETAPFSAIDPLSDRLYHMLNHQLMCDVIFRVGSTPKTIKSHKFMFASASPVFYSMFEGSMAEKGAVSIPDIEADVFNDILT
jgi:hypothetical protein